MAVEYKQKILSAAKWSAVGEVMAKLVTPISTVILARVLTPQAFGVVATITMIISFADIFMDAGFQRYVIQKEYETEGDKFRCANVAFWTNFVIGLLLWISIFIFREPLARVVGNPGLGLVLSVAAISIPINAITSIQMAVFKHSLDFKSLFYRRIASVIIPLVITVPLAFVLRSYWALVWGALASSVVNAIVLTFFSPWRPKFYYNFTIVKGMVGYSSWTLLDAVLVWATSYVEIFFIGVLLNEYYLGLYKTAISTVAQFMSIITSIILPVLMPAFSRSQHDIAQMRDIIYKLQDYLGFILIPFGGFIFLFRVQLTSILLGSQWGAISLFIGIWTISEVLMLLFSRFCSNIYPAIGKPHYSVCIQVLHLIVLIPAVYISAKISFEALYWTRTLVRLEGMILNLYFAYKLIKLSPWKLLINNSHVFLTTVALVFIISYFVTKWPSDWGILIMGPVFISLYFLLICIWARERVIFHEILNKTVGNVFRKIYG